MKHKTDEEFRQEVYELVGDSYTFLDPYINSSVKIRVKHNECGHVYQVVPAKFLVGRRCPYCTGHIKKTDKEFKQEVYNLVGNAYTFLDPYVNNKVKMRVKHNKCGNTYKVTPNHFLRDIRCPYCSRNANKTDEEFKQEVYELVGDSYTVLDPYINNYTKLRVKHNECGKVYEVKPSNLLSGSRCPYCFVGGKTKKKDSQFRQEVKNLVGNEYTFIEQYQGADNKISIKHNKCGKVYGVRPTDFFSHNARCPYCNSPRGELIIGKLLDNLNINYETQKTFPDLKDKISLSYDFYLPSQNILIEYQGKQHYQPIDYFGGEVKFKTQQKHDHMKLEYAKEHGYRLIAIPYTEDNFSKIKKYLIKHGLN